MSDFPPDGDYINEPLMAQVIWNDTTTRSEWHTRQQLRADCEGQPDGVRMRCSSVGWLVWIDEHRVSLVGTLTEEDNWMESIHIPRPCVTEIKVLAAAPEKATDFPEAQAREG